MTPRIALTLALAAVTSAAVPCLAQQTGVSQPPEAIVNDAPQAVAPRVAQPMSASVSATVQPPTAAAAPATADEEYKPYVGPKVLLHSRNGEDDPDAGIVTEVPRRAGELPVGTQMRVRLREAISTTQTPAGTPFTAEVAEAVLDSGRVVLPAGATIEGTVTQVRGGKRIHGTALLHLQPQFVVLPDGTREQIHAAVIDTDQYQETRTDTEGNILRKDHVGATLAAMSLTTGGAAAAGGVLGGPAGALIGAGVGAGVGTAFWLKQDRQAHLPKDTLLVLGLTEPLPVRSLVQEPEFSALPMPAQSSAVMPMRGSKPSAAIAVEPQAFVPTN